MVVLCTRTAPSQLVEARSESRKYDSAVTPSVGGSCNGLASGRGAAMVITVDVASSCSSSCCSRWIWRFSLFFETHKMGGADDVPLHRQTNSENKQVIGLPQNKIHRGHNEDDEATLATMSSIWLVMSS